MKVWRAFCTGISSRWLAPGSLVTPNPTNDGRFLDGNPVACAALFATLPDNPRECREQAQLYDYLARTAEIPADKEHFASLAASWMRLAAEIEGALALLNALNEIELDEPKSVDEPGYSEAA